MLTSKSFLQQQNNLWHKMINFDQSPKGSNAAFSIGTVIGWIYYLFTLLDLKAFGWEFFIKLFSGAISAVVIGFVVKVMNTVYEENFKKNVVRISNKIFKKKKHKIEKDSTELTA